MFYENERCIVKECEVSVEVQFDVVAAGLPRHFVAATLYGQAGAGKPTYGIWNLATAELP